MESRRMQLKNLIIISNAQAALLILAAETLVCSTLVVNRFTFRILAPAPTVRI